MDKAAERSAAPPLVPAAPGDVVQIAEEYLDLMGSTSPDGIAGLARALAELARSAGAREIAEAAAEVDQIASGKQIMCLTGALARLSSAVAKVRDRQDTPAPIVA